MRKSGWTSPIRATASDALVASLFIASLLTPLAARADFDESTGRWVGDVSAETFDEYCRGELPSDRHSRFLSALETANLALASRDLKAASNAFADAREAAYRGGADSDVSIKCLGESAARRWFNGQLEFKRQRSAIDSRGSEDENAALYVTAAEQGVQPTISWVERRKPRRFVASIRTLEQIVDQLDRERRFGAFLLNEEELLAKSCRDALTSLRQRAAQEHRDALRREENSFSRPATDRERAASEAVGNVQGLAKTLTGFDLEATAERESLVLRNRANESRDLLRLARLWNLEIQDDRQGMPASRRARQRGDEMLARAGDANTSVLLRDALYGEAQHYYDFGGFKDESASAASARDAIQPELRAERDRREERLDQAGAELKERAESAREAAEKLKKSAAEQKRFKDEADAMESELGF